MIIYKEFGTRRMDEVVKIYERAGWSAYLNDREKLVRAFENSLYILGAFEDARLVGFVRCVGDGEHILYVQDLIVDEEFKRRGVGKALLQKAMEKYANVRMFTLITDAGDEQANAFYHAVGMRSYADSGIAGYSS